MSIQSDIQSIITTLYPDATYMLASRFRYSVESQEIENTEFPLIVLNNELTTDKEIQENRNTLSKYRIQLTVLKKDDEFNNDEETDAIRQQCEDILDRIMMNIYDLDAIRVRNGQDLKYRVIPIIKATPNILSGVAGIADWDFNQVINC